MSPRRFDRRHQSFEDSLRHIQTAADAPRSHFDQLQEEVMSMDGSTGKGGYIGPKGPIANVEFWLRARGCKRLANVLGRIDEIGL